MILPAPNHCQICNHCRLSSSVRVEEGSRIAGANVTEKRMWEWEGGGRASCCHHCDARRPQKNFSAKEKYRNRHFFKQFHVSTPEVDRQYRRNMRVPVDQSFRFGDVAGFVEARAVKIG